MTVALLALEIDSLTADERIELADKLWESLRRVPDKLPLTEAQAEEIDRRVEDYRRDREAGQPWREALAEIRNEIR